MLRPLPPILLRKLLLLPRPSRRRSMGERGRLHPLRVSPALLRSTSRQRYQTIIPEYRIASGNHDHGVGFYHPACQTT